ncbi:hypothetical protein DFJ73DRAFT_770048 [Zopfochytrium polystomum]|nr:hypothetical protein DFJ73DRAFT_770048 [Zopfochytrium polystomum]
MGLPPLPPPLLRSSRRRSLHPTSSSSSAGLLFRLVRLLCHPTTLLVLALALHLTSPPSSTAALPTPATLYRGMTAADRKAFNEGRDITAVNPSANIRPEQHQSGVKQSQYISTTSDPKVAEKFNRGGHGIVKIDTDKLPNKGKGNTVDMKSYSEKNPDKFAPSYREKAAKEKEVLVKGNIPRSACTLHACGPTASTQKAEEKAKARGANNISLMKAAVAKRAERKAAAGGGGGASGSGGASTSTGKQQPRAAAAGGGGSSKSRPSSSSPSSSSARGGGGTSTGGGGSPKKQQQQPQQLTKSKSFSGGSVSGSSQAKPAAVSRSKSFSEGTKPKPQQQQQQKQKSAPAVRQQSPAKASSSPKAGGGGKKKFREGGGSGARCILVSPIKPLPSQKYIEHFLRGQYALPYLAGEKTPFAFGISVNTLSNSVLETPYVRSRYTSARALKEAEQVRDASSSAHRNSESSGWEDRQMRSHFAKCHLTCRIVWKNPVAFLKKLHSQARTFRVLARALTSQYCG